MAYSFSGRRIIAHFGSPTEVRDLLVRHKVPLTYGQIRKWSERDTISADGLAGLIMLAKAMRLSFDPSSMIKGGW